MNVRTSAAALKGATALSTPQVKPKPAPVTLTQKQLLEIALDALTANGLNSYYNTAPRVEDMAPEAFANYPVAGTGFEPIANALNAHGVPTEMTLAGVAKSLHPDLEPHQQQHMVHQYICSCIEGNVMLGSHLVGNIYRNNAD